MQDMTRHPWHRFGFALGIEQGPPAHPLDRLEQLLPAPSQQRHLLGLRTEVIKASTLRFTYSPEPGTSAVHDINCAVTYLIELPGGTCSAVF